MSHDYKALEAALSTAARVIFDSLSSEAQKNVFLERQAVYGDPSKSHANIGLSWTALIQQHYGIDLSHPIPDFLVAQMMAGMKLQRSTRVFHEDNYIDASNYTEYAREFQKALLPKVP